MPTKLQHYVPQFYLQGFADAGKPGTIWVYEKGQPQPRSQGIKGTAAETHYYSLERSDGTKDDVIEREVLGRTETRAAPVIQRWRADKRPGIALEGIQALAPFLATCFVRSPLARQTLDESLSLLAREIIREASTNRAPLDEFLKTRPDLSRGKMLEALEAAQDPSRMSITPNRNVLIAQPLLWADEVVPYIVRRGWTVLEAPDEIDFVTSDCPLSVFRLGADGNALIGAGIGLPDAVLTLPLSPRRALRLSLSESKSHRRVGDREVKECNRRAAAQATRYVYASREAKKIQAVVEEFAFNRGAPRINPVEALEAMRRIRERSAARPAPERAP